MRFVRARVSFVLVRQAKNRVNCHQLRQRETERAIVETHRVETNQITSKCDNGRDRVIPNYCSTHITHVNLPDLLLP